MATLPLTIDADADAVRAYMSASPENRKKMQLLMNLRLKEVVAPSTASLREVMDRIGSQAEARGLTPEILESILDEG